MVMRAVQVSFHADDQRRDAESLLRAWPTLPGVAAGVARAGVEVTVVQAAASTCSLARDGVNYRFVDDDRGMPVRRGSRMRWPSSPSRIIEAVASLEPDVVHVQGFGFPRATHQLMRAIPGVPVLVQDHASSPPRWRDRRGWRRAYAPIAAAAFTAREQATPFLRTRVLSDALPIVEVLEGSCSFTPGDQSDARRRTGIGGDPCLLWTGHLDANKDPLTTLDALERAARQLPDARLWCCFGTAPLREWVDRRIAASSVLRGRVTLLGARPYEEMEWLFRAADLFVQSSHHESCGYSTIEALACGTPPIVTALPATRRIVGDAGAMTPVGDAAAQASAMVAWGNGDRSAQRRAARARFESALTFEAIGLELRAAYVALQESR
jgi:glycosyltransferase involved in cell wall biosynthesis